MQNSLFIPADKVGTVVMSVCAMADTFDATEKRHRLRGFKRAEHMLRALRLLPDNDLQLLAVSVGMRSDGQLGIVLTFENASVASTVSKEEK